MLVSEDVGEFDTMIIRLQKVLIEFLNLDWLVKDKGAGSIIVREVRRTVEAKTSTSPRQVLRNSEQDSQKSWGVSIHHDGPVTNPSAISHLDPSPTAVGDVSAGHVG